MKAVILRLVYSIVFLLFAYISLYMSCVGAQSVSNHHRRQDTPPAASPIKCRRPQLSWVPSRGVARIENDMTPPQGAQGGNGGGGLYICDTL